MKSEYPPPLWICFTLLAVVALIIVPLGFPIQAMIKVGILWSVFSVLGWLGAWLAWKIDNK